MQGRGRGESFFRRAMLRRKFTLEERERGSVGKGISFSSRRLEGNSHSAPLSETGRLGTINRGYEQTSLPPASPPVRKMAMYILAPGELGFGLA